MLTEEQIKAIAESRGDTLVAPGANNRASELDTAWGNTSEPSFMDTFSKNLKTAHEKAVENVRPDEDILGATAETGVQALGVVHKTALDLLNRALSYIPGYNKVPDELKAAYVGSLPGIATANPALAATGAFVSQAFTDAYQGAEKLVEHLGNTPEYQEFKKKHPNADRLVRGTLSALQTGLDVELGKQAASKGFDVAIETPRIASETVGRISSGMKGTKDLANNLAKFATSQATGLSPETVTRIIQNPEQFSPEAMKSFTREGVGNEVISTINKRLDDLSETGKEYAPIRKSDSPIQVSRGTIDSVFGDSKIKVENGRLVFDKESIPTTPADQAALQNWYSTYGENLNTANSLLNARKALDLRYEGKSGATQSLINNLRTKLNEIGRGQIEGLKDLDARFSSEAEALKQVKTDYFNPDGTLKDNAISKIANLSNKGKESILARLENISPGVGEKIRTLKAVEDIQAASGQKVGAYARGGLAVTGLITGNVPAIVAAILSEPHIATKVLRGYGKLLGVKDSVIEKIVNSYEKNSPSPLMNPDTMTESMTADKIDINSNIPPKQ